PGGLTPITNRVGRKVPGVRGKLLDAHYDGASSPTAVAAGSIAAARAEPQNRQRVLLRYQRRVSRRCTFHQQGGQSRADPRGGASPPLCGGPSRSADAGTWDSDGRGGISSQPVPVDQAIQAESDENRPCPRGPTFMAAIGSVLVTGDDRVRAH